MSKLVYSGRMSDYYFTPAGDDHELQMGRASSIDGHKLQGRSSHRDAYWGFCAFCGWRIGGQDSTRAIRRAFNSHVASAKRKAQK